MGVAQVFVGKIFVHRLQTTKSTKILPLENYPLYGNIPAALMALTYQRTRWPEVTPTHTPPPQPTHTLNTYSYVQENTGSLFLIGGTVTSSTEHEQDNCSFQLCCSLIDQTVPSSTRGDKVAANATTKKVNEQNTKTFPKCYVRRNGMQR